MIDEVETIVLNIHNYLIKKGGKNMTMKRISCWLSVRDIAALKIRAIQAGCPVSDILKALIAGYLADGKSKKGKGEV